MNDVIKEFLSKIALMKSLGLTYRQPGDGSDGTCDCIGLIIGAIRRMGLKWSGIHGSNFAARRQTVGLKAINTLNELSLGDVIYKAYGPGAPKYSLPSRYKPGGAYYNGDLRDYYHVGVITSLNPLQITHMTSPTVIVQTIKSLSKLGNWNYYGKCKPVIEATGISEVPYVPEKADLPSSGKEAIVKSENGAPVKMRKQPTQQCNEWVRIPVGTVVTLESPGETWAKISCGKRKNWYMMAKFLEVS